ncbi:PGF-CTERM sorting domain-containing protein [Natronorubrum aibiense]|nr:PGF-CTERM sorting domain-containing protein [Natronorubrum aibiense]
MNRQVFSKRSLRSIATVMMAVVLITSSFAGTALADVDEADPADEVFVDENGDAVLVYDEDSDTDTGASGEVGLDVSESVVYALITDDMEDDVSAALSMEVDGDSVDSSGSFAAKRPTDLSELSMDVLAEQNQETSTFDADLEMEMDAAGPGAGFTQVSASGTTVSSADEFSTDGEFSATMMGGMQSPDNGLDLELTEADGSYTLDVHNQDQLNQYQTDNWRTEADATQTLEAQFSDVAAELGGDVTVSIDAHEFQENADGTADLDVEYTVEFENVKDGLESAVADGLASESDLDLDQDEAEQLAADLLDAEIETFDVSYLVSENTVEGAWEIAFTNLDSTTFALFDLAESAGEMDDVDLESDEYVDMYEAQAEADLVQTSQWKLSFSQDETQTQTFSMDVSSDAENWEAYTQELDERDIDLAEFSMTATAETVDDEIEMEMTLEMTQEALLENAISAAIDSLEDDPTADDEALEFMTAFDDADLELAKFDLNMDDGTVEMETGAKFDDITAFEDHLEDAFYGHSVTHVYANDEAGYVYVTELVDGDATEDDVRTLEVVDDDTTVHMPGEWDDEHPRLDMDTVTEYLELNADDDEAAEDTDESDDGSPGFGVAVALVALLSTALLFRRN